MSKYITRISHFTFRKDGDTLVVQSERASGFEQLYAWLDEYDEMDKDELNSTFHEKHYTELRQEFRSYES